MDVFVESLIIHKERIHLALYCLAHFSVPNFMVNSANNSYRFNNFLFETIFFPIVYTITIAIDAK